MKSPAGTVGTEISNGRQSGTDTISSPTKHNGNSDKERKRKRITNKESYKLNVVKRGRLSGTKYINHRGNLIAPKATGNTCE